MKWNKNRNELGFGNSGCGAVGWWWTKLVDSFIYLIIYLKKTFYDQKGLTKINCRLYSKMNGLYFSASIIKIFPTLSIF